MIKCIFNGYFRSGTTLIYKCIVNSGVDAAVFYEPFHENLLKNIYFGYSKKIHNLEDLFEPYKSIDIRQIKNLSNSNKRKRIDRIFWWKDKYNLYKNKKKIEIIEKIFNNLKSDVILQTNRYHLNYESINAKIFHIIRNPIDVKNSLIRLRSNNRRNIRKIFYDLMGNFIPININFITKRKNNYWHSIEYIEEINKIHNLKLNLKKIYNSGPDSIIISWVLCNYFALKSLKDKENIIIYEELITEPDNIIKNVYKKCSLILDKAVIKSSNKNDYMKYFNIKNLVDIYRLREFYDFILKILAEKNYNIRQILY